MFPAAGHVSPSETGCPSAPPKSNKDKQILRAPTTTLLRSPAELRSFKHLISPSKSETKNLSNDLLDPSLSPSSSAIVIGGDEDILTQILLFLPPKSLIRFQCVSKHWFSLISSLRFRLLHTSQSPTVSPSSSANTSGLFLYRIIFRSLELNSLSLRDAEANSMGIITSRFIDFLNVHGEILNIHSCGGLFCLDFHWNNEVRRLCVYNPTTNQYRLVQWPDINEISCDICAVNIVFNPLKPDHYKIVCLWSKLNQMGMDSEEEEEEEEEEERHSQLGLQLGCFLYSSETLAWKDCPDIEPPVLDFYFKRGVFLNGNLYWASVHRSLLYFDAEHECIGYLSCGSGSVGRGEILYFGESNGNLHLIVAVQPQCDLLELFEWEENLEDVRWVVKYRVNLSFLTALYPLMVNTEYCPDLERQFAFGILCFHVEEKGKKAKLIISFPGKIISYEVNDMTVEELVEIEPAHLQFLWQDMSWYVWEDAYKHMETLACV